MKKDFLNDFSDMTEAKKVKAIAASHAAYARKKVLARYLAEALESSGYIRYTGDATRVVAPASTTGFRKLVKDGFNLAFASREELVEFLACMGKVYKQSTPFAKTLMALFTAGGVETRECETKESKTLECETNESKTLECETSENKTLECETNESKTLECETSENKTLECETNESKTIFLLDTGAYLGRYQHWLEISERGNALVFVTQCAAYEVSSLARGGNAEVVKASKCLAEHPEIVLPNPEKVLVTNVQELITQYQQQRTRPANAFRVEQIIQTAWTLRKRFGVNANIFVIISNYVEHVVAELILNSAQTSVPKKVFVEKNHIFLSTDEE